MQHWEFAVRIVHPIGASAVAGTAVTLRHQTPFAAVLADPPILGDRIVDAPVAAWAAATLGAIDQRETIETTVAETFRTLTSQTGPRDVLAALQVRSVSAGLVVSAVEGVLTVCGFGEAAALVIPDSDRQQQLGSGSLALSDETSAVIAGVGRPFHPDAARLAQRCEEDASAGELVTEVAEAIDTQSLTDPLVLFAAVLTPDERIEPLRATQAARAEEWAASPLADPDEPPVAAL